MLSFHITLARSTQQDIYAAGSENRPPTLNKENYVPWSSRLLHYAKSRPNGKLIYNSIMNGPYVRRMIPEPGDADREVPVNETFHEQTDDKVIEKELKQVEVDDQAIQTILLGLPEDIYAAVDICESAQEIWFTSTDGESIQSYYHRFSKLTNDFKRNKHFLEKIGGNSCTRSAYDTDKSKTRATSFSVTGLVLARVGQEYQHSTSSTYMQQQQPVNNYNPQPSFNQNYMQQPMPNPEDITDPTTAMNDVSLYSVVDAQKEEAESNSNAEKKDQLSLLEVTAAKLMLLVYKLLLLVLKVNAASTKVTTAQRLRLLKEFLLFKLKEFDLLKWDLTRGILLLGQQSTSGTQTDKAPVYDSDGSAEVQLHDSFYDNYIFNMFTQEEQYTELLEPILKPHQVQQNDSNVIFEISSVEQSGGTVTQHPVTVEETRAYFESLYNNLAIEVEKVNTVKHKLRETNADLTTELARYKNQESVLKLVKKNMTNLKGVIKKADESLVKHKALGLEIERLLRAVFSQDIMFIVQNPSVVDTSNLQTELERTKERFENYIIKKENEYAKLWNDFYKKCEECKYDKISYDKAYNDMQQKIEQLQS
ncbi:hypothetical protein Tco_0732247 [Tanacetum coccineum]